MNRTVVFAAALAAMLAVVAPASRVGAQHNAYVTHGFPNVSGDVEYDGNDAGMAGMDGYYPGGGECCGDGGYPGYNECDPGCCDSGYGITWSDWCDWCCPGVGFGESRRWFFTADYLYVRANFSEAVAYVIQDDSGGPSLFTDTFHDLNFQHESSYRFGGGYKLGCCDEELRFLFTRMSSFANDFTNNPDAIGPFETSPGPGGTLEVDADVDAKSWDLEYAKTIPLGGTASCECGDACGCGDGYCGDPCGCGDAGCCPPPCPAWDLTWSGGLRFADVEWSRHYLGNNPQAEETRDALSTMDFEGGGPRFGLLGRRYFGQSNWCSAYLKGDVSLLWGHLQLNERRTTSDDDTGTPDVTIEQSAHFRNIIPVTEIEAGLSAQLASSSRLSAGYLFSAWHDLGFRDQFGWDPTLFLDTNYDDANILGFDGLFVRLDVGF